MFRPRGGNRKPSTNVRYLCKIRASSRAHVLRVQTLGVLRTIGIHLEGANVTWSTVDLKIGKETRMARSWALVTDHVVVRVEHFISSYISNVRVVPGLAQAISDVD